MSRPSLQECLNYLGAHRGWEASERTWDELYGRHSNVPACCVKFYLDLWPMIYRSQYERYDALISQQAYKYGGWKTADGWRLWCYVPCPDCLKTGHVHQLNCCDGGRSRGEGPCDFYPHCPFDERRRDLRRTGKW
jgi:hypothetical protein